MNKEAALKLILQIEQLLAILKAEVEKEAPVVPPAPAA